MVADERLKLLEANVSVLEKQVRFLLQVNGLDLSVFRNASNKVLLELYRDAVQLLAINPGDIDAEVMKRWAEIFMQLSEYELTRLQDIVGYDHTWEPFYQLCIRMMTAVRHNKRLPRDVGLQHLYALLDRDRQNLRDSAIMMIKNGESTLPTNIKVLLRGDKIVDLLPK